MNKPIQHGELIRPQSLHSGDTIGVIAPASVVNASELRQGCETLRQLGYNVIYDPAIIDSDLYFAGELKRRVDELHMMFRRPDVKAIVCSRGGYGSNYLLPQVDLNVIRENPKIFVGYSDNTTLLTWLCDNGLTVFHGPMVAKDFAHKDGVHIESWHAVLGAKPCILRFGADSSVRTLVNGTTSGILYGGCLSMLVASLGTPYEIQTTNRVLFIEDVGAKPYQVDRMLMQLQFAGKLDEIRGIIFGEMLGCVQPGVQSYTLQEVVMQIVGSLGIPVIYGFPSGHVERDNVTLPIGGEILLTASEESIELHIGAATIHGEK